jgi:signal transduction histidine kinase
LSRADGFAASSLEILHANEARLREIMIEAEPFTMAASLDKYRDTLEQWKTAPGNDREALQDELRTLGHTLYLSVESLSRQERSLLEAAVRESQWFLLISLFIIGLSIYFIGRQMNRVAVMPLKQLEASLMPIAEGQFDHLDTPSGDREFIAFTNAFNRMLKELEIRQKRMLQSEKLASLGILASGVAHELNNPLSNISTSCQLLMEEINEADPEQLNTWLKQIDSETERGKNIVRSLLDFGSQRNIHKQQHKLLDIINDTKVIINKMLRQHCTKLSINVPADLTIVVDKQQFQQLFINLIQNAIDASDTAIELRISAMLCQRSGSLIPDGAEVAGNLKCIKDKEKKYVEILIKDNGPGIPAENLSKVFNPFYTTSEPGHGAGLGLYIVQEIVNEHGGCLAISSEAGKGTQVIVLLPGEEL